MDKGVALGCVCPLPLHLQEAPLILHYTFQHTSARLLGTHAGAIDFMPACESWLWPTSSVLSFAPR